MLRYKTQRTCFSHL